MKYRPLPHIAFQVRDYEKAIEFYEREMGMTVVERGGTETRLTCGDTTFYVEDNLKGHTYLSFEVEDLARARAELAAAGCRIWGVTSEGCMVSDPFGGLRFYLSQMAS